jgi:HD-GYP domain-containing protein (c-di-GMP phosphodiesterase class II)
MFRLSIAGLFHDIGKKEIDRAILEKPRGTLTQEEVKILESHPKRALEILGGVESIPEDVLQIILHHHERDAGNGYPSGLRRQKIHPLARVIAVADEFVKLILKGPDTPGMDPKAALIRLSRLQKGELDGKSLEALAGILHIDIQREPSFR